MRAAPFFFATALAAASLAGCSSDNVAESPNITASHNTPAPDATVYQSLFELEPGLCFNHPDDMTPADTVPAVDCDLPHDAEVFAVYDLTGITVYDQDAVTTQGNEGCVAPFADYVGVDFYAPEANDLGLFGFFPSEQSWAEGDHEVVCSLAPMTAGEKLTGSMRNALG